LEAEPVREIEDPRTPTERSPGAERPDRKLWKRLAKEAVQEAGLRVAYFTCVVYGGMVVGALAQVLIGEYVAIAIGLGMLLVHIALHAWWTPQPVARAREDDERPANAATSCPKCGSDYEWDGTTCGRCGQSASEVSRGRHLVIVIACVVVGMHLLYLISFLAIGFLFLVPGLVWLLPRFALDAILLAFLYLRQDWARQVLGLLCLAGACFHLSAIVMSLGAGFGFFRIGDGIYSLTKFVGLGINLGTGIALAKSESIAAYTAGRWQRADVAARTPRRTKALQQTATVSASGSS
jgi:hypothetical protein